MILNGTGPLGVCSFGIWITHFGIKINTRVMDTEVWVIDGICICICGELEVVGSLMESKNS